MSRRWRSSVKKMEDDSRAVILHGNTMYSLFPLPACMENWQEQKQYILSRFNVLRTGTWHEHLFVRIFSALSYEDHG